MDNTASNIKEEIIALPESLDRQWVASHDLTSRSCEASLVLDFAQTERIDSAGICFIRLLHSLYTSGSSKLVLRNISKELLSTVKLWNSQPVPVKEQVDYPGFKASFKKNYESLKETGTSALSVLVEMIYWGTFGLLKRQDYRKGALGEQMYQLGYKAFGIVALLSFLIGLVLALQTAMQLKTYGAGIFLAPLIGITMVREFGPLLTAIILAGRTGSATTAEIATMAVGEELDALQTMGINPIQYVVVPKFWAITLTMPVLSIIATFAGIIGGYFIAVGYLDLASSLYWSELSKSLTIRDFTAGFVKSVAFSWLIIWVGSFYGFRVRGGAEAVGRETTASVVTGIFIIILADALFSFVL